MADPTLIERVEQLATRMTEAGDRGEYFMADEEEGALLSGLVAEVRRLEAMQTIRAEILLNVQSAGYEAGARAMREALKKRAAEYENARMHLTAFDIEIAPVPPAPSPAHDGKEGA